ncbi:MAG TPA: HAD-IA family hydrolase [Casimicrobiaceae bacterium]|jgi:phosphoglycolate phosphatase
MTETASSRAAPRPLAAAAILFDLDGTLADTAGDLTSALNRVRAEHGLAPLGAAALRPHASSGARGLIGAGMGVRPDDERYPALRDAFLAYYEAGLAETTRLFDGIDQLLNALEERSLRWGVVTNKAERFTWPVLTALGLAKRASVVVSGDTTTHPKPHPAPLLYAADSLSLAVDRCVYVGDDLRDVQAGNAAGMPTIVAAYGYLGETGDCTGWPATGWIASPGELLSWLA